VDLMIAKVDERLKDRDMGLELRPAAKALLAERGYDPVLGARPLRRTIQRAIEDMLSEKILFGELRPGQIVIVDVEGEGEEGPVRVPRACRSPNRSRTRRWPRVESGSAAKQPAGQRAQHGLTVRSSE
jgi:ATP-dependent Clp protease ATP-binding subunit ClpC